MFRQLQNLQIGWFIGFMFLTLPACFTLQAQAFHYEFQDLPMPREMSGFVGKSIFQDSDGFMWFGSKQGLFRYDGSNFRQYTVRSGEAISTSGGERGLRNDKTLSFLEDRDGALWFGNWVVLARFDRKREIFQFFQDPDLPTPLYCMMEDSEGFLWVASISGLSRFDRETGTFKHYTAYKPGEEGKETNPVWSVYEDGKGVFWVNFISGGMAIFDKGKGTFEYIDPIPAPVMQILEDASGRILVVTQKGLYYYDKDSNTFTRQLYRTGDPNRLDSDYLEWITRDGSGQLWITSFYGIYQYSENLEKLNFYRILGAEEPEWLGIVPNGPRYIYFDRQGTLWFFHGNKIGRLVKRYDNFTVYEPAEGRSSEEGVRDTGDHLFVSNTSLFFGGYYMINRKNHTYSRVDIDPRGEIGQYGYSLKDRDGNLWVATQGHGLYRGSAGKEGLIRIEKVFSNPPDSSGVLDLNLRGLFEDSNGRIWLEVQGHRPCFYDPELDRILHLVDNPHSRDEMPRNTSDDFALGVINGETNDGNLLASHHTYGIFAIIPPFIRVSEHAVMPSDVIRFRTASGDGVIKGYGMYESPRDSTGVIWTTGGWPDGIGLQKLVPADAGKSMDFRYSSKIYSVQDGLPTPMVNFFIEDNQGNFWLFTWGAGIVKFNPDRGTCTVYNESDGLSDSDLKTFVEDELGEIYVCTTGGSIFSFHPDSIRANTHVPPVYITDLKINQHSVSPWDSTVLEKQICYTTQVRLTYRQSNLSFSYSALDYSDPSRNQYKYKLEGFDHDWIIGGNRTGVDYTNLEPGKYRFRVTGSNNDGTWNDSGAMLDIKITPPPWKTPWAYLIYALLLTGILMAYRRFLIKRAKTRAAMEIEHLEREKLLEMDRMKSRFFANISHEFRTPLTLILGPVEDFLKKSQQGGGLTSDVVRMISRNAKRLQNLINQLLDLARMETGELKLHVSEGDLEKFTRNIILSFLSLAESRKIRYSFELPGEKRELWFDGDKVEKILVNLISNAFKFTSVKGEIRIRYGYVIPAGIAIPEWVEIAISDTGKGIPHEHLDRIFDRFYQVEESSLKDEAGTGIGLALIKELTEIYRGDIRVDSRVGEGSTFTVRLPVSKDKFREEERTGAGVEVIRDTKLKEEPVMYDLEQEVSGKKTREKLKAAPIILIVEDNPELLRYISGILTSNYRILSADNGKKGLEVASDSIPDLVISDVMMPEMDGIEMCRKLREDERTSHIPLIMLSARADLDSKLEGLETGADDYLIKPFDSEEMTVRVRNLIEQRKKLNEKFRREFITESPDTIGMKKDQFLNKLIEELQKNIAEPDFSIDQLGRDLHMSRSQLYRKVGAIAGLSPHELLRMIRMKRAAQLLQSGELNVTQVMYQVGMRNTSNFSRSFHHYFGTNPSDYRYSARS